jgi:hypothetical protein
MGWKRYLLGNSTTYEVFDEDAVRDNQLTYYSIIVVYLLMLLGGAYLIIVGYHWLFWMLYFILGHLFVCMLFLMKVNNFLFMFLNSYRKGRK